MAEYRYSILRRYSMNCRRLITALLVGICSVTAIAQNAGPPASQQVQKAEAEALEKVPKITVEELKAKLAKNEPVAIIDVRATDLHADSPSMISGALHVKLRRLRHRLTLSPLKDIPKDREVVTYCACPAEESSNRAAVVFKNAGYKRVRALQGGWAAWLKAGGATGKKAKGM
jgi:rhodanese-related sulfurtransferase